MSAITSKQQQNLTTKSDSEWAGSDDESSCNEYIVQEITVIGDKPTKFLGSSETVNERMFIIDKNQVKSNESINNDATPAPDDQAPTARAGTSPTAPAFDTIKSEDKSKETSSNKPDTSKPMFDEARKTIERISDSVMKALGIETAKEPTQCIEGTKKTPEPVKDSATKALPIHEQAGGKPSATPDVSCKAGAEDAKKSSELKPKVEHLPALSVIKGETSDKSKPPAVTAQSTKDKMDKTGEKSAATVGLTVGLLPDDKSKGVQLPIDGNIKSNAEKTPLEDSKKKAESGKDKISDHKTEDKPTVHPFYFGTPLEPLVGVDKKSDEKNASPTAEEAKKTKEPSPGTGDKTSDHKQKSGEKLSAAMGIPSVPSSEDKAKSKESVESKVKQLPTVTSTSAKSQETSKSQIDEPKKTIETRKDAADKTSDHEPKMGDKSAPGIAMSPSQEKESKSKEPSKVTVGQTSDDKLKLGEKKTTAAGIPIMSTQDEKPKIEQLPIAVVSKPVDKTESKSISKTSSTQTQEDKQAIRVVLRLTH